MALRRPDLQPASYNGVVFHVEAGTRSSGRRIALHEFPKRDKPYAENMGRKARRFSIAAYVIGPNFRAQRDALIEQLETEGPGSLILPTGQTDDDQKVVVENYSVAERRVQGLYAEFEISFIEAGQDLWQQVSQNTQGAVTSSVDNSVPKASSLNGNDFTGSSDITQLT